MSALSRPAVENSVPANVDGLAVGLGPVVGGDGQRRRGDVERRARGTGQPGACGGQRVRPDRVDGQIAERGDAVDHGDRHASPQGRTRRCERQPDRSPALGHDLVTGVEDGDGHGRTDRRAVYGVGRLLHEAQMCRAVPGHACCRSTVEAVLLLPAVSVARDAAIEATTVPEVVIPVTATAYVAGPPDDGPGLGPAGGAADRHVAGDEAADRLAEHDREGDRARVRRVGLADRLVDGHAWGPSGRRSRSGWRPTAGPVLPAVSVAPLAAKLRTTLP